MIHAHATVVYAPHDAPSFPPLLGRMNVEVEDTATLLDIAYAIRLNVEGLFRDIARDWKRRHAASSRHQFTPLMVPHIRVVVDTNEPVLRGLITTAFRNAGITTWKPAEAADS